MTLQRQRSLGLLCQCRKSSIGRRRADACSRRLLNNATASGAGDNQFFSGNNHKGYGCSGRQAVKDLGRCHAHEGSSQQNDLAKANLEDALSFEALSKFKEFRRKILATLRNPWPSVSDRYSRNTQMRTKTPNRMASIFAGLELPEANAALIPHATFRKLILHSELQKKDISRLLRTQLLRAQAPRDIYRILAVSFRGKDSTHCLAVLWEPIVRALYRSRANVSDPEILKTINVIIRRFEIAGLAVPEGFVSLGLRFAARTRSLEAMKRYLRRTRQAGTVMNANVFRSVIAKFSIGHRGLGEIRNGRWNRSDLLQVLKGFGDCTHLPDSEQYHLGTFLVRSDWQYLHGWVAALARCKDADAVWEEWELWKRSPARRRPRHLNGIENAMTTKRRGDYWFVEQMAMSGDIERAWKLLDESNLNFSDIKGRVAMILLERPELASPKLWESGARDGMVDKYDHELKKIENAFGIEWRRVSGERSGYGTHEVVQDQWVTMEQLGADNWKIEENHGFPHENEDGDNMVVAEREDRALHVAEERGLAEKEYTDT